MKILGKGSGSGSIIPLVTGGMIDVAIKSAESAVASLPPGGARGFAQALVGRSQQPELASVLVETSLQTRKTSLVLRITTRKGTADHRIESNHVHFLTVENARKTAHDLAKRLKRQASADDWTRLLTELAQNGGQLLLPPMGTNNDGGSSSMLGLPGPAGDQ